MNSAPPEARRRLTSAIIPALAVAGLAGLATLLVVGRLPGAPEPAPRGCLLEESALASFGGPIDLVDPNGRRVTQAELAGAPALLYFGFTHCPDVCPTAMYAVAQAIDQLGEEGVRMQPVLITVDPERDTTDVMDAYIGTEGFPEGLIGLTGTPEQVRAAANAFKVYYARAPIEGSDIAYNMDHTSLLYIMDGSWKPRGVMPTTQATPTELAACISRALHGTGN